MSKGSQRDASNWGFGSVLSNYEGGSKGPATISNGKGDKGGVSYGLFQFSTASKTADHFIKTSGYSSQFGNLQPDTKEFNDKWEKLGKSDPDFATAQIDFAKKNYYDQTISMLEKKGIDLSDRSMGVQEAIWSTSIQYGTSGATHRFVAIEAEARKSGKSLNGMSDEEIVSTLQDRKLEDAKDSLQDAIQKLEKAKAEAHPDMVKVKKLQDRVRNDEGVVNRISQVKDDLIRLSRNERPNPDYENLLTRLHSSNLQKELNGLGYRDHLYKKLGEDAQLGRETRKVVREFQHDNHLDATGIIDPATEKTIDTAYEDRLHEKASQTVKKEDTSKGTKEATQPVTAENKAAQTTEPEKKLSSFEAWLQEGIRDGGALLEADKKRRQEAGLTET